MASTKVFESRFSIGQLLVWITGFCAFCAIWPWGLSHLPLATQLCLLVWSVISLFQLNAFIRVAKSTHEYMARPRWLMWLVCIAPLAIWFCTLLSCVIEDTGTVLHFEVYTPLTLWTVPFLYVLVIGSVYLPISMMQAPYHRDQTNYFILRFTAWANSLMPMLVFSLG